MRLFNPNLIDNPQFIGREKWYDKICNTQKYNNWRNKKWVYSDCLEEKKKLN